jgi:hypothetical protein
VLAACRARLRSNLRERAVNGIGRVLAADHRGLARLGHPNLLRTDLAEVFSAMAAAEVEWRDEWRPALERLQRMQGEKGRWRRISPIPESLGVEATQPSKWITLKATRAVLAYAVDGKLPRLFPYPPNVSP